MSGAVHWLRLASGVAAAAVALGASASLREDVERLASEALEGRLTGTPGEQQAADYLSDRLRRLGAVPLPGRDGFQLPFEFTAGTRDAGSSLALAGPGVERRWTGAERIRALSFSDEASVSGPVVFAGYGLRIPDGQALSYDSYASLDVRDKIAVVLRYFPEDLDQESRALLSRYSGLRYKALVARENGAKGLLVVTGPNSPNAGNLVPMTFDAAIAGSGIPAASLAGDLAEALFELAPDTTLEQAQSALDAGDPAAAVFEFPDVELALEVKIEREQRRGRNVVGLLPGDAQLADRPYVVVGAHYDHLGHGTGGNSLASGDEVGKVHAGADDNASGVAAVLEIGRQLAGVDLPRRVVLCFWSGEELGMLGSKAFLDDALLPQREIAAYLNFDMVGRMRDNKLALQAVGTSPVWPALIERANVPIGFDVTLQQDPYLPTDSTSFDGVDVPTLNVFTGPHEDYHRPSDVAEKLAYDDLQRVADFGALFVRKLAEAEEPPEFARVERTGGMSPGRASVRAYTGTIPDYTAEVDGLMLGGVIPGGPADRAGLRKGDVIVQFGSQAIANIYDYTYALDAVKIGEPISVVYVRDGARLETRLIPEARE